MPSLNAWLEARCIEQWSKLAHGALPGSVAAVHAEERASLMPLSRAFDGFVEHTKRVSPTCGASHLTDCASTITSVGLACRPADDAAWEIAAEKVRLVVEPGRRPSGEKGDGPLEFMGVPFGSHARLILLYLQTEALRTNSREIELGRSLRDWLGRIGVSVGGRTGKLVKDQAERISRCRLTFHLQGAKSAGLINQSIVDRALFIEDTEAPQGRLSLEMAKLSEGFFEQLQRHPVPLEEAAIRAINNNPAALDCYLWLAYRLHALNAPRLVTWKALKGQFGGGFKEAYHFKNKWSQSLQLALAVYHAVLPSVCFCLAETADILRSATSAEAVSRLLFSCPLAAPKHANGERPNCNQSCRHWLRHRRGR